MEKQTRLFAALSSSRSFPMQKTEPSLATGGETAVAPEDSLADALRAVRAEMRVRGDADDRKQTRLLQKMQGFETRVRKVETRLQALESAQRAAKQR